jgi:osmotically-inducible protein OsmY
MTYKSDEEIRSEVLFQLGWDSCVTPTDIGVTVKKAVVTLTGMVGSYAEKLAAKEAAHKVRGVLDVANEIEVKISGEALCTDAEIARAVRHSLEWDVFVPSERIHSTVTQGWVTLEGSVESYYDKLQAEHAVSRLVGVRGVTNKILVATTVKPSRVRELIEEVLEVRADREAGRIKVSVEDGEVTLTGAVKSWDEKKSVLGAVSHASGVVAVQDHLFIDPYDMRFESAGRGQSA